MAVSYKRGGMKSTGIYKQLEHLAKEDPGARDLLRLVERVFGECVDVMKTVTNYMRAYTLHDEVHLTNVVNIMDRLMPARVLKRLQPMELAALILSAALHDIGMAPTGSEVRTWLRAAEGRAKGEGLKYQSFRQAYQAMIRRQHHLREAGHHSEAQEIEAYIISEYLRKDHAKRARKYIFNNYDGQLKYKDFDFASRLADVCFTHTEDPSLLETLPCWELLASPGEYCNWRFVAVLLRLADILDFDPKRTPRVLFEHLGLRSPISVREWKKHRAVTGWDIGPGKIAFAAQCPDPVIEKCVRDFVRLIDRELLAARGTLAGMHDGRSPDLSNQYHLDLAASVNTSDIQPAEGPDGPYYEYVDLAFHLDQESIKALVMGVHLYADRHLFLRELLQNAMDTCRHRRALHEAKPTLGKYVPYVTVRLLEDDGQEYIEVEDNGMGMNEAILRNNFARLGTSYYTSAGFLEERASLGLQFQPIAQYGIGVLSAFMAGDLLHVETCRSIPTSRPLSVEVAGQGALFWFTRGSRNMSGTRVRVRLTVPSHDLFGSGSLFATVSELVPHVEFPIAVEERGKSRRHKSKWRLPEDRLGFELRNTSESIDLNLTRLAPDGLDGIVRLHFLQEGDHFISEVRLEEDTDEQYDEVEEDILDRLRHEFGVIQREHRDWTIKGGLETGFSSPLQSGGRWSQQGIHVAHPLFPEFGMLFSRPNKSYVPFPLPVLYDLNLTHDFYLPLSADRKTVLPGPESEVVCQRIAKALTEALFQTLGIATVRANRSFFERLAALEEARGSDVFRRTLDEFVPESRHES